MRTSIIIPVWKGASVIGKCLDALLTEAQSSAPVSSTAADRGAVSFQEHLEIICVDNASNDESANLIVQSYPQVRLIQQPVNLGFSGGVNAGIEAARGNHFILLNQDCIVQPGWLQALLEALQTYPQYGLLGCTILNPDGSFNHTGAMLSKPDLHGVHITDLPSDPVYLVDYATGAALAIRRQAWEQVGAFDEGFYPAYFEDVDYAYRARRKGIQTGCALHARVQHLFSSREWENAPIRHAVITHTSRYRFACKHLSGHEIARFFISEQEQLQAVQHMNHAIGRLIAARTALRTLRFILAQRSHDLAENVSPDDQERIKTGLSRIFQQSYARAKFLTPDLPLALEAFASGSYLPLGWQASLQLRHGYNRREHQLLESIFFRPPDDLTPENFTQRLTRRLLKRLPSHLSGRDNRLWNELAQVQRAHIELLSMQISLLEMLTEYE